MYIDGVLCLMKFMNVLFMIKLIFYVVDIVVNIYFNEELLYKKCLRLSKYVFC